MKRYFIEIGKMKVHITEWGQSDKPVIFCLHGLGSTSFSFIEIAEAVKNDFRIVSIDAPGHGKSTPFEASSEYEMPRFTKWLSHVLDALSITNFYFLSHSWGSFVALYFLHQNPQRVKGSILIDGGYQTKRRMKETLEEEINYYEKDFEEYIFNNWSEFFQSEKEAYTRWSPLIEVAVKDLGVEHEGKVRWHARGKTAKGIIQAMHKHETEDIYEEIHNHLLLLAPQDKDAHGEETLRVFEKSTNSVIRRVPETTHMLHWDNPYIVIEEIYRNWKA